MSPEPDSPGEASAASSGLRRRLTRRIVLIAALLLTTLGGGTIGFRIIEGFGWFDAFYMTLITITTVGYQELHTLGHTGRIFNSFLIFFGVSAMFLAVGTMTQTIVEIELQNPYGNRRKRYMITELKDHFIVCGFGRVGRNASYELQRAKVPFIVLDRNQDRLAKAESAGILAIGRDATRDDSLREVGVLKARGLISALPSDAENLFVILSAKALNPRLTIVTRASEEESEEKLRRAGADTVFAPYTMAGRQLANALLRPHVLEFLDLTKANVGRKIVMEQVRIAPEAARTARTVGQILAPRDPGVIVLALHKTGGETLFNPPAEAEIAGGDFLIVLGERTSLDRLEHLLARET